MALVVLQPEVHLQAFHVANGPSLTPLDASLEASDPPPTHQEMVGLEVGVGGAVGIAYGQGSSRKHASESLLSCYPSQLPSFHWVFRLFLAGFAPFQASALRAVRLLMALLRRPPQGKRQKRRRRKRTQSDGSPQPRRRAPKPNSCDLWRMLKLRFTMTWRNQNCW